MGKVAKISQTDSSYEEQSQTPHFNKDDFDLLVKNHGCELNIENAIPCPCKEPETGAKLTCLNCGGIGWIFTTPITTSGVVQNLNKNTQYKDWSAENLGTSSLTIYNEELISYMDRVTIINSLSVYKEILSSKYYEGEGVWYLHLTYPLIKLISLYRYDSEESPLVKVPEEDYTIDGFKLVFNNHPGGRKKYTIQYRHNPQFHILDLPHDVRDMVNFNIKGKTVQMPLSGIMRRSHNVLDNLTYENKLYQIEKE